SKVEEPGLIWLLIIYALECCRVRPTNNRLGLRNLAGRSPATAKNPRAISLLSHLHRLCRRGDLHPPGHKRLLFDLLLYLLVYRGRIRRVGYPGLARGLPLDFRSVLSSVVVPPDLLGGSRHYFLNLNMDGTSAPSHPGSDTDPHHFLPGNRRSLHSSRPFRT